MFLLEKSTKRICANNVCAIILYQYPDLSMTGERGRGKRETEREREKARDLAVIDTYNAKHGICPN